jgi:hypothetical protein
MTPISPGIWSMSDQSATRTPSMTAPMDDRERYGRSGMNRDCLSQRSESSLKRAAMRKIGPMSAAGTTTARG